jgi:uncharacterized repeat protein (TIGR01451 family)
VRNHQRQVPGVPSGLCSGLEHIARGDPAISGGRNVTGFGARALAMLAALLIGVAVPAGQAVAGESPQLSIAVDGGRSSATSGDVLEYTVTVRNLGLTDVAGLTISQSVPPGLEFRSADPVGESGPAEVRWKMDLPASGERTVRTTMSVRPTPDDQLRLATVACARAAADAPPVVCASDSVQLPAGAASENALTAAAGSPTSWLNRNKGYVAGGAVVAVVIAILLVRLLRRRRSPRSEPG